jgi:Glycosyl transferase family 2
VERVCIVRASGQNVFFDELLGALEHELQAQGVDTERATDHFPAIQDGTAYLFVPHEYVPLTEAEVHPSPAHLRRSVVLCTEQPGNQWFDMAAEIAERAGAAVDINPEGAAALRKRGVAARVLRLGWTPLWDLWGGDESQDRPIDVIFLGSYTRRRAAGVASCGGVLAGRPCYLNITDARVPQTADSGAFLSGVPKWEQLARSRLMLNVHRSRLAYLEWQRVVEAISNGAVVVSEHSLGAAPLVPGEHFVSSSYGTLHQVLQVLLEEPERVEAIRRSAYALLREQYPLSASIGTLRDALEEVAAHDVAGMIQGPRHPRPRSRPAPWPPREYERLAEDQTDTAVIRMALKHVLLAQHELRRRVEAVAAFPDDVRRCGPHPPQRPRVSVILTVYNYAHLVTNAIGSVAQSELEEIELVIVDDASTDESREAIRAALDEHPSLPVTLVLKGRNEGLPRARNTGLEHARGDYVFILDADNSVYPHGLGRLANALDADPEAAFAYGLLEVFDATGACDLMSWREWDPEQLRYGNYVDAMAMIRRAVLESVGGYTTDPRLYGWEDFSLWCTLAERGWRGIRVPEIVARYRKGLLSMISLTDIDGRAAWSALLESHSILTSP